MVALSPDYEAFARSILSEHGHDHPSPALVELVEKGMKAGIAAALQDFRALRTEAAKVADEGDAITAGKIAAYPMDPPGT
jgi:trehalose utilization protein